MKAIYSSCAVGLNNGKVLDGDVIDEVAQETIGAILSKLQEEHQTYEVVSLILETAAEHCNGLWLATCIQAIAVLILALTVSRMM